LQEGLFFGYKSIIGDRLRTRHPKAQEAEASIVGDLWTVGLTPQGGRGPGPWTSFVRSASTSFILDVGLIAGLPAAGLIGLPWFAQALVFGDLPSVGGAFDAWFSTAVGGAVGSY